MYTLYGIYNTLNGKLYIGISKNLKVRWSSHKKTAKSGKIPKMSAIHFALAKYGFESFIFKAIENYLDRITACEAEILWIKTLKELGYQLYNETKGGESIPEVILTPQQRKKLSERMKGEKNYFYGKKLLGPANGHYGHKMQPHVKEILLKHHLKLTTKQVEEIRTLHTTGNYTQTALSQRFGVALSQINKIILNRARTDNPNTQVKKNITMDQAKEIKNLHATGDYTQTKLAAQFNLSITQIHRIVTGKRWKCLI